MIAASASISAAMRSALTLRLRMRGSFQGAAGPRQIEVEHAGKPFAAGIGPAHITNPRYARQAPNGAEYLTFRTGTLDFSAVFSN